MAIVKLLGDSSGYVQLVANTAAQNNTLTLPNVNDTLANITSPTFLSNIALAGTGTAPTVGMFTPSANTLAFATNTTQVVTITSTGNVGIGSAAPQQTLDVQGNVNVLNTVIMGSSFLRNRIINGGMSVDQRNSGASQTITAGAALAYTVDRFYAYCTGANVTGSRVANSTNNPANNPSQYAYQFAGAASVTGIGFGTRIEAINCWDLAGTTATLSVNLANGLLTTVTWTAAYANSTDSFGSLASPTVTQIATGTFTVNAALSRYSVSIPIPIAATTGIQIVFTVGAQTSQTWQINNVQLEPGPVATPFERRLYGQELLLCQRYYYRHTSSGSYTQFGVGVCASTTTILVNVPLPITMRVPPTAIDYAAVGNFVVFDGAANTTLTGISLSFVGQNSAGVTGTVASGLTQTRPAMFEANGASTAYIGFTAEL